MDQIDADVAEARTTARWARRIALVNWSIGVLALAWVVARIALGYESLGQAIEILTVIVLASLTTGIGLFVSSSNLTLSITRVELQRESKK